MTAIFGAIKTVGQGPNGPLFAPARASCSSDISEGAACTAPGRASLWRYRWQGRAYLTRRLRLVFRCVSPIQLKLEIVSGLVAIRAHPRVVETHLWNRSPLRPP